MNSSKDSLTASVMFFLRAFLACMPFLIIPATEVSAQTTTYTYTGGTGLNGVIEGMCGLSGSFTTAQPLPPNYEAAVGYTSFTFTDCLSTITNLNTTSNSSEIFFNVVTDGNGQIGAWGFNMGANQNITFVYNPGSGNVTFICSAVDFMSYGGGIYEPYVWDIAQYGCLYGGVYGVSVPFQAGPGTWTSCAGSGSCGGAPVSIVFVDPVPALVQGTAINQTPDALATLGTVVQGVAADGVATVVLRITTANVGDTISLTLLNDSQQPSTSPCGPGQPCEDGFLSNIDGSGAVSSLTLTSSANPTGSGSPMAFALYTAPIDFVRSGKSDSGTGQRQVFFQANGATPIPVTIVRPPVLFIHGLWSGPSAWTTLKSTLPTSIFNTYSVNYLSTNGASVSYNSGLALSELRSQIVAFKQTSNVAAIQFDFVTHSMGGLIARYMAAFDPRFTDQTLGQGRIHKLITIDTPHNGSPFATNLNSIAKANLTCPLALFKPVAGAISDLAVGSPLLSISGASLPRRLAVAQLRCLRCHWHQLRC
jgi:pimeloyl-ACP methyl ester carboxylesterase